MYVGLLWGGLCREHVSAGNVNPRAKCEHGYWQGSLDLNG